jgi:hypothetical protein|eukprot:COSAG01_NODE_18567_length_1066_cov_1.088843_1_plen_147_part_00
MPVGPPSKDLSSTSARHTHDQYQAKWDKWDNDEFIEQMMAESDDQSEGRTRNGSSAKGASHSGAISAGDGVGICRRLCPAALVASTQSQRATQLVVRLLPALVVGLLAYLRPPSSTAGWALCATMAVATVYLSGPTVATPKDKKTA